MPQRYVLTRRATRDMAEIEAYTMETWGEEQTDRYMTSITDAYEALVEYPDLGLHRMDRAAPFRMVREQSHFIVYDVHQDCIVIAAVPHARADIEGLVRNMTPDYRRELEELKARFSALYGDGAHPGRD